MLIGQIIYIWLVITILGAITFPLLFSILPGLKDRGYSISKIVGLVLITYVAWILSSLKIIPFNTFSVGLSVLILAGLSFRSAWPRRREITLFLREQIRLILGVELLFLIALAIFLFIISLNPNIDPDSERFMDYALINSIDRTDYFPPLDPWFGGQPMNYYYYGYIFIVALHKLVAIPLPLFFNLALGLIYSIFTLTCFGIGYNLTGKKSYGLLAAFALIFIGNLDGFIQIIQGHYRMFDFFHSARVLVQKAADGQILDYPINEFPFFSLMWGDLHPYVIAFPLNMAILNFLYGLAVFPRWGWKSFGERRFEQILFLVVLVLLLGALFGTNTWDYPIYLMVAVGILAFNHWKAEGRLGTKVTYFLLLSALLFLLSFFLYAPFNLPFLREQAGQGRGGIGLVSLRSPLGLFLVAFGIFLFFLLFFALSHLNYVSREAKKKIFRGPFVIFLLAGLILILASGGGAVIGQTYLFLFLFFLALLLILFFSPLETSENFALIISLSALGLAFICEFFFLIDHYQGSGYYRMNTVFKIYVHVWLFLGTAAVYSIAFVNRRLSKKQGLKRLWKIMVAGLLVAGFFYPYGALSPRLRGRNQRLTLEGFLYIQRPVPPHQKKEWRWDIDDWKAAQWIEDNIQGRPVILETVGNAYDWASRISTFTGLPTLVGWVNHEAGWRNDWIEPGRRNRDTQKLYNTTDSNLALNLIDKYNIQYVYIGKIEREQYSPPGLEKFARLGKSVYRSGPVEIWKVGGGR